MFRWFQDWRERRTAIRGLKEDQERDEALLADRNDNPFLRAQAAVARGDFDEAATLWEEARVRLPNVTLASDASLAILLELRRFDEAEALIEKRRKLFPRDRFCLIAAARIAHRRDDMPEAAKRWKDVIRAGPTDDLDAHLHAYHCLVSLGRLDEAAATMDDAIRCQPGHVDGWMVRAAIAEKMGNQDECLKHWRTAVDRFGFSRPLTGYIRALTEFGRAEEARTYLEQLGRRHPADLDIASARARLARQLGDLTAASERWREARTIYLYFRPAYEEAVECLQDAGEVAAAEELSREAIANFPDKPWPWIAAARLAHRRQDWSEAVARWDEIRRRFPEETEGHVLGAEAAKAAGDAAGPPA